MIYLDSAATTLIKPASVKAAVTKAIRGAASPGRGGHLPGQLAEEILFRCRVAAAEMFCVPSPEQVVLTSNATHGLNIAIRTLVKANSTVLISGFEHNAVTRTLYSIPDITTVVACGTLYDPDSVFEAFSKLLDDSVDVVICNHVSNVFGFILPVERIAALCRQRRKPLIVDASQSAGALSVDLAGLGAEFIAMPGHKGLYGPQGTGLLLCGHETAEPLLFGGTGGSSVRMEMPDFLPDRLEAGTQNVCGAAGLLAGMQYVRKLGTERILRHEHMLCDMMTTTLKKVGGLRVFWGERAQSGLFSFVAEGVDCEVLGTELGKRGVAVRAGLHCAPLAHRTAGTLQGGTVRVSVSSFNTREEIDAASEVICRTITALRARNHRVFFPAETL